MSQVVPFDVIIVGAGASGLMAAMECGKRGRSVLILEKSKKPGRKILMAGGGYCNFTNYHVDPSCFLSQNPHFCKSALRQYTQWDFIELVNKHEIAFHEKTKGQLFCDTKEGQILKLLLAECQQKNIRLRLGTSVENVEKIKDHAYQLRTTAGTFTCESLIVATGGLSIPSMGSSPWGYQVAEQFGLPVHPLRAGLVPLTLHDEDKVRLSQLSGVSFDTVVHCQGRSFHEHSLITHRGLSGPAILQISSYWQAGQSIEIDCLPERDIVDVFQNQDTSQLVKTRLSQYLPKRFLDTHVHATLLQKPLCQLQQKERTTLADRIHRWVIKPNGTEGYRTAEVTLGGVDCDYLSSKTMEANAHKGLYFVGEVLDVTGWLGGYNFQWAWSSGFVAGQYA
ncbi:MAG: NAD(P)/FAD-dependent oxidoreductase [Pseudomonadota bacterium]|nr:NAD(P)/FAD-dependent oxidoreductase [Pseudomonadota bacterium]MEC8978268.1 NAD(P)/FAD-dependent oxidoreductase [Pseudomonadota bacterium]